MRANDNISGEEVLEETFHRKAGKETLRVRRLRPRREIPGRPWLVFLHEGLGSIEQWKGFPERVCAAAGSPGLVYDRRGFGGSDPIRLPRPLDYLPREAEESLAPLLNGLNLDKVLLVGHSDGGTIALYFASLFPARTLGCVTMAAHVFVEEETLAGIREAKAAWDSGKLKGPLARYHGEKTSTVFHGWVDTWLDPAFRDWSMLRELGGIEAPLLVIQGRDDEYGTPRQVEAIVEHSAGQAWPCIIERCGHSPHVQSPEATLDAVLDFMEHRLP